MAAQTDFRPQLHGFDFDNHFDTDDNYRNFIRQKVRDALPIAAKAIATNPAIGAALLAALGAAYGIGEALLPGLFDSIAIPIIINQIINKVNDEIDNGLPDHYGACGGMSFVPLDYFYQQWVIPKGIYSNGQDADKHPFLVPPLSDPQGKTLRDYIYQRFEDTWDSGGVLDKMLEWFVILKTIPSDFGGGGPEVQSRCKGEWVKLAGLLDQGKPQPIALLFDTWDIFDNHQVVAYGYGGDPATGSAFVNIYDNNNPNQELFIRFDFTQGEMAGQITDVAGTTVTTKDKNGATVPQYEALKGFFCTTYTPQMPPLQSWGVLSGLAVTPGTCQSAREVFNLGALITNNISFFQQPGQITRVTPVVSDPLSIQVIPPNYQNQPGQDAYSSAGTAYAGSASYNYPGAYVVQAKAYLQVIDAGTGTTAMDQFNQPLGRLLRLPALNPQATPIVKLSVLERLKIAPVNRSGDSCYFPFFEGGNVILQLQNPPFSGAQTSYWWQTSVTSTGPNNQPHFEIFSLPPAGDSFTVSVRVINLDTGCVATGNATFTTYSADMAGKMTGLCKLRHIMSELLVPGIINPLGPDDPERYRFIESNLPVIRKAAERIAKIASDIEVLHTGPSVL